MKRTVKNIRRWLGIKTMREFGYEYASNLKDEEIRFILTIDKKINNYGKFEKGMEQCLLDRLGTKYE